jgi:hypothetical protein
MKQGMECPNFLSKENQTFHKNWGHSIAPWLHWGPGSGWDALRKLSTSNLLKMGPVAVTSTGKNPGFWRPLGT